jgi:hypothetical protein
MDAQVKYANALEPLAEINEIERLRRDAEEKRDRWLRNRGWEYTSSTPGCYWMWKREGYLVDTSTAERLQGHWDGERAEELHPERYED